MALKIIPILFLHILLTGNSYAQVTETKPFKTILADAINGFTAFKGKFITKEGGDSVYNSTVIIQGTYNNRVFISWRDDKIEYMTDIMDTRSFEKTKAIVELWKRQLSEVAEGFSWSSLQPVGATEGVMGYSAVKVVEQKVYLINLKYTNKPNYNVYCVTLGISALGLINNRGMF